MPKSWSDKARAALDEFLKLETAGGLVLVAAAALALVVANIPALRDVYDWILAQPLTITLGSLGVDKPLLLWINDALMALFFLLVGLELKREIVEGQLSEASQLTLPVMAAVGGLVLPALIFWWFNADQGMQRNAWAVPTATDIAFALAVLGLFGSRVPLSLKLFLASVAIVDDMAAITIIALFFTDQLSLLSLGLAMAGVFLLAVLNRRGVSRLGPYALTGLFVWLCILKSGVHATLAGVIVAMFIPLKADDDLSPARHLEHILHPWVVWAVLPLFAFANSGVVFSTGSAQQILEPLALGIVLGLVVGKPVGVVLMVLIARVFGLASLPEGTSWRQMVGVGLLCGIGFTMSLFIGSLAFELGHIPNLDGVKLAVLTGSAISALLGLVFLHFSLPRGTE